MAEPVTIRDRIIDFRRVKASELIPHPDNFREHPDEQRAAYRAIVESVGIAGAELARLLPDGRLMLIDGHMRREEHPDMELPVLVTDLNAEEAEQVLLTYDPLAAMAKTNAEKLDALLQRNNSDRPEIQRMMAELAENAGLYQDAPVVEAPDAQIDRAEELQQVWNVQRGQLWIIPSKSGKGEHRLLCGDSTNADDVARVMAGERADICFTSPPYNAGTTPTEVKMGHITKYSGNNDDLPSDSYLDLLNGFTKHAIKYCEYVFVNIQMLANNKLAFIDYLYTNKRHIADIAIWDKTRSQPAMAENVMNSRFEFILCLSGLINPTRAIGVREFRGTVDNVVSLPPQTQNKFSDMHNATFPLQFVTWATEMFSNIKSIIYDPFLGSGTTFVACEQTGRQGRGLEIEPKYCSVILQRMQDMGLQPQLAEQP